MARIDMHVHTDASFDCTVPGADVAARARQLGLEPLFVTDHETVDGALRLRESGVDVVVGQEITTAEGELIGLFLSQAVPQGLTPEATAAAIKDQGGLVYLQHPYDTRRRSLPEIAIERIAPLIDIVEIHNGRSQPRMNEQAAGLQETLAVAPGAGSDAHRLSELGTAYLELPAFEGPQGLLDALAQARLVVGRHPLLQRATRILGR